MAAGLVHTTFGVAAVTANVAELEVIPFWDAVTLLEPTPTPVARPLVLTFTTAGFEDSQTAELVRSCLVPSLNVPVARNCCVSPYETDGFVGLTLIDCSTAAVT